MLLNILQHIHRTGPHLKMSIMSGMTEDIKPETLVEYLYNTTLQEKYSRKRKQPGRQVKWLYTSRLPGCQWLAVKLRCFPQYKFPSPSDSSRSLGPCSDRSSSPLKTAKAWRFSSMAFCSKLENSFKELLCMAGINRANKFHLVRTLQWEVSDEKFLLFLSSLVKDHGLD